MQAEYREEGTGYTAVNTDAVQLFFHLLVEAHAGVQRWGLHLWIRLLCGNMANLAACERCSHIRSLSNLLLLTSWV